MPPSPTDPPIVINLDDDNESLAEIDCTQDSSLNAEKCNLSTDSSQEMTGHYPIPTIPLREIKTECTHSDGSVQIGGSSACLNLATTRNEKTGLYGKGKFSAAILKVHMNPSCIPVLDTPNEGTLHIIIGWKPSEVLSDNCYRYESRGTWRTNKVDFLVEPYMLRKRKYQCNGVMACPVLLRTRSGFNHSTEEEWEELQAFVSTKQRNNEFLEMKKARNLYVTLTNPDVHFCPAMLRDGDREGVHHDGHLHGHRDDHHQNLYGSDNRCRGKPILRQVRVTKEWFVGCTHYYVNRDVKKSHYFYSLRSFTPEALKHLRGMLDQKKPIVIPGDICEFVSGKKGRGSKRCATHGIDLVECGTDSSANGRCVAEMILMEPIGQQSSPSEYSSEGSVTFAICKGEHNHPPPPQPDSTERKNSIFRKIAETSPMTTAAILKLQTQTELRSGSSSSLQNLNLSKNYMYNTLGTVRRMKQQDEYSSLFEMVGSPDQPYVRDVRVIKDGVAFLLATEKMLRHAGDAMVFAGDATFKTVKETNPHYLTPNWYLYNIVAPEDPTTPTKKGVVVCRALMTTLTTAAYTSVWVMFLKSMREVKANFLGLRPSDVCIDVTYMNAEPERKQNSIPIRAVTTDFEVAEVDGIAAAFAEQRGGSMETHLEHLLIGCRVHFERAVLKRAKSLPEKKIEVFKEACRKLRVASTIKDADDEFAIIDSIDNSWGSWLSRSHVRPLVSQAYSRMSASDRMIGLDNTNIVESQNRRGNLICGTRLDPVLCTQRLLQLDTIAASLICMGDSTSGQHIPRVRKRHGHTLAPSSGKNPRKAGSTRGKKRKKVEAGGETVSKEKRSNGKTVKMEMDDTLSLSLPEGTGVISSRLSESLTWLHNELGRRCQKAVEDGNNKLTIALSGLYQSVLQCDDLNKIKYCILSTMNQGIADKRVMEELTEILMLTSQQPKAVDQGVSNTKQVPLPSSISKKEDNVIDVDTASHSQNLDPSDDLEIVQVG